MKKAVYLFVFDSMADWEAGHAVAGINNPEHQTEPGRFVVKTAGVSRDPVMTIGGVTVLPDTTLEAIEPPRSAMLILPGGTAWEAGEHGEAAEKAGAFLAAGVPVAAICGATLALARAGLLDEREHTSNAREYLRETGYRGSGRYRDEPAVTDGEVITASGTAPVEFAYHIFRQLELYEPPMLEAWSEMFGAGGRDRSGTRVAE
jgi:putative intracellular protease/amidase